MRCLTDILYNFHWVVPGQAARAAQAWGGRLGPFLHRHGIRGVINLRGPNPHWRWWHYERRICARAGIMHLDAMLSSKNLPSRAMLTRLFEAFDQAPRPFLLKCSGGQDRTSFAAALFIIHHEGWQGEAAALAQFAGWPYLHMPKSYQRWLRLFIPYARDAAHGVPLARFIQQDYDVAAFQAWLDARGETAAYRNVYREA
ncbi:MAG: hypothetical protein KGO02_10060 [Alphaproteobacteria bacterium]|nr:hypothetical protein [Alphaproteobacteria bacterium]